MISNFYHFQGDIIYGYSVSREDICQSLCFNTESCQWYSFNKKQKSCFLLEACSVLDESFVDFLSGQVECFKSNGKVYVNLIRKSFVKSLKSKPNEMFDP